MGGRFFAVAGTLALASGVAFDVGRALVRTRVTQEFQTVGRISAISSWLFSRGSYEGSFRGELEKFGRIAERETRGLS